MAEICVDNNWGYGSHTDEETKDLTIFVAWGKKKSSGSVVMTYPERPQREGQHLQSLVLARTKMTHSLAWSRNLSTQDIE